MCWYFWFFATYSKTLSLKPSVSENEDVSVIVIFAFSSIVFPLLKLKNWLYGWLHQDLTQWLIKKHIYIYKVCLLLNEYEKVRGKFVFSALLK